MDEPGRILAIDYGRRRVGLAISDPTRIIATGLETMEVSSLEEAVRRIVARKAELEFVQIVVGLPMRTSGAVGEMAEEVRVFVDKLRDTSGVPVTMIDERFTSAEATRIFHAKGKKLKGRKGEIDQLAAELILRQYLDSMPMFPTDS